MVSFPYRINQTKTDPVTHLSSLLSGDQPSQKMARTRPRSQWRPRSPWACSLQIILTTFVAVALLLAIVHAFITRQLDPKGCDMCWSRPMYIKFADFDTEHTRFASKYSLYLLREGGIDEDAKVQTKPDRQVKLTRRRSRVPQYSSSPGMPEVISRLGAWNPSRPSTTTT